MAYNKRLIRTTVALTPETRIKAKEAYKAEKFTTFTAWVRSLIDRAIEQYERAHKGA